MIDALVGAILKLLSCDGLECLAPPSPTPPPQSSTVLATDPNKPGTCFDGSGTQWMARKTPDGFVCLMADKPASLRAIP